MLTQTVYYNQWLLRDPNTIRILHKYDDNHNIIAYTVQVNM